MKQRITTVLLALAVGFMYPDVCFTKESYEVYDGCHMEVKRERQDAIEILQGNGKNIKVKSRLFELLSQYMGE